MESVQIFKVFVSSPGDLKEERSQIMNYINSLRLGDFIFNAVLWEKDLPVTIYEDTKGAQGLIEDLLLRNCDILLGLFRLKFGTKTHDNESGTKSEIEAGFHQKMPVILYFWETNKKIDELSDSELDSFLKIKKFQKAYEDKGVYSRIHNMEEFKEYITRDLEYNARKIIKQREEKGRDTQPSPDTKQYNSEILISEEGLYIYRTGNLINFEQDERLLYRYEDGKYVLNQFEKGTIYKHFVLCNKSEADRIKSILHETGLYNVTGSGSAGEGAGKWKVWFIVKAEPVKEDGCNVNNYEVK